MRAAHTTPTVGGKTLWRFLLVNAYYTTAPLACLDRDSTCCGAGADARAPLPHSAPHSTPSGRHPSARRWRERVPRSPGEVLPAGPIAREGAREPREPQDGCDDVGANGDAVLLHSAAVSVEAEAMLVADAVRATEDDADAHLWGERREAAQHRVCQPRWPPAAAAS